MKPSPSVPLSADCKAFNVRAFGAAGDGRTLDTNAINCAIEGAYAVGGGIVLARLGWRGLPGDMPGVPRPLAP